MESDRAWRRIAVAALALSLVGCDQATKYAAGAWLAGVGLILAGGVSNAVDRVIRGSVVDLLNVGVGPLRTGWFNVADMAVMAGTAMILVAMSRDAAPE